MKKRMLTMFFLIIVIFSSFACSNTGTVDSVTPQVEGDSSAPDSEDVPIEEEPTEPVVVVEPEPIVTTATLAAVGDVLIHSSLYKQAKTEQGYDFKPMFELVKPIIEEADVAIANQETMIGGVELGLSSYPRFNSPFEVGDALKDMGFDIVSLANNHTLDVGEKGILNAIAHWKELGIEYTGAYESEEDRVKIRTIEKNDITFSFLSYTYGTNGIPVPKGKDYLVNLIELEKMKQDVTAAKQLSDVIVASLHFGTEYQKLPNETQKTLVAELANAGVDIIIGHHPHVLQPAEWITREDGKKTFVVYSLGNFIAGQDTIEKQLGGIIQIEVEKITKGDQSEIHLKNPSFVPTYAYHKNYKGYKIYPLEILDASILNNAEQYYESVKSHMNQWVADLEFPTVEKLYTSR